MRISAKCCMVGYHAVPVCSYLPLMPGFGWLLALKLGILICFYVRVWSATAMSMVHLHSHIRIYGGGPLTHVLQVLLCSGGVQGFQTTSMSGVRGAIGQAGRHD